MIWVLWLAMTSAMMPIDAANGCNEGDVLPLLKRHEIQVLLDTGFSPADVARRSDTSVDTVRRVCREARVAHTDDHAERRERRVGRPSKAAPFTDRVTGTRAATLPSTRSSQASVRRGQRRSFGLKGCLGSSRNTTSVRSM
jgi:hypothetical protein